MFDCGAYGSGPVSATRVAAKPSAGHCDWAESKRRSNPPSASRTNSGVRCRRTQAARRPETTPAEPKPFAQSQDVRTGTVGYFSNGTSMATKSNTPIVNIPQSMSAITKDFIRDQGVGGLTDCTRYVPGVAVHQGEGNRDELVIRGADSIANFFVNSLAATIARPSAVGRRSCGARDFVPGPRDCTC